MGREMNTEEWRAVPDFNDYRVSNMGRVESVKSGASRILHPILSHGYFCLSLYRGDRPRRIMFVHQMVAAAFIGPCPDGCEINHINGTKTDNRVENLEYATHRQNMQHAFRTGLQKGRAGEKASKTK